MQSIQQLLLQDPQRLRMLNLVASLKLKDAYIAAGFVRNMVWDELHKKAISTPLNDVDVVFFDAHDKDNSLATKALEVLQNLDGSVPWQVKNQAHMHLQNKDRAYFNTCDAMTFWPEKETAIGVQMNSDKQIKVLAPFGTRSLFQGLISHNSKRAKSIFLKRVHSKDWLDIWPQLRIFK